MGIHQLDIWNGLGRGAVTELWIEVRLFNAILFQIYSHAPGNGGFS
jgi:hypothetical protein